MRTIITTLGIFVLTTCIAAIAMAGPRFATDGPGLKQRNGDGPRNPGQHLEKLQEELDLSTDQRAAIKEILEENRAQSAPLREKTRELHQALQDELAADEINPERIRHLTTLQAEARAEQLIRGHATREQVEAVLTPEQRTELASLREKRDRGPRRGGFMPTR